MRAVSAVMTVVFVVAVGVQWNDPDPLRWTLLYGLAAAVAGGVAAGRRWARFEWVATAIFVLALLPLLPSLRDLRVEAFTSFGMRSSADEGVRELFGVALCLLWCASVVVWRRREGAPPAVG